MSFLAPCEHIALPIRVHTVGFYLIGIIACIEEDEDLSVIREDPASKYSSHRTFLPLFRKVTASVRMVVPAFAMAFPNPRLSCSSLLSLSLLSLVFIPTHGRTPCYFPAGDVGTGDYPCYPSRDVSFCCGPGYACLANQVCMRTDAAPDKQNSGLNFVRGSCTDQTFTSASCPQFCLGPTSMFYRGPHLPKWAL